MPSFHVRSNPAAPVSLVQQLGADPDDVINRGVMVKAGDRTTIVTLKDGARDFCLKRFNAKGPLHTITHFPLRSRAAWNRINAASLEALEIATPRVHATVEERFARWLRRRSFLLTDWIEGLSLDAWAGEADPESSRFAHVADQFASAWVALGGARLRHGDMKATNFLVDADDRLWFVDLDGMRRYAPGPLLRRARQRDLARFFRNWQDAPEVAQAFRARIDRAIGRGG